MNNKNGSVLNRPAFLGVFLTFPMTRLPLSVIQENTAVPLEEEKHI